VLAALVALALSACGGGGQDSAKDEKVDRSARLANAFDKANINPLVGDWRRIRTCDEYVHQIKQAGLEDMVPTHQDHQDLVEEFGTGNAAQSHQDSDDPCQGVNGRLPHDHIFYKDGQFASVNQNGEFVDHGHYKFVDDRTIKFGDPPGNLVHFRFSYDGATVTFDLDIPDMDNCSQDCREETKYRLDVFYPGHHWHRVCQEDYKDNNYDGDKDELGEPCWVSY
jgi:hypothetical protein